jgi:hypothetical protein
MSRDILQERHRLYFLYLERVRIGREQKICRDVTKCTAIVERESQFPISFFVCVWVLLYETLIEETFHSWAWLIWPGGLGAFNEPSSTWDRFLYFFFPFLLLAPPCSTVSLWDLVFHFYRLTGRALCFSSVTLTDYLTVDWELEDRVFLSLNGR